MTSTKLKVASISDIHLGHHRTKTTFILDNLRKAFPDNAETASLDVIFFVGDVFDRHLTFPSDEVYEIQMWIMEFLALCRKHDIMVRVLEGTPSHDWRQSRIFETMNKAMGGYVDLKYASTLMVEYIERFDSTVLYVPDEWTKEADETWRQAKELLKSLALDKVDFCVMHGAFDYQIPMKSVKNHLPERYLSITRHYIFIGHVHIRSQFERILAQGSFDRLSHGEEAAKGHYRVTIEQGKDDVIEFVENEGAKLYCTLDYRGTDLQLALENLKQYQEYPDGSHFRLKLLTGDELISSVGVVKKLYPQFFWTTHLDDLKTQETSLTKDETEVIQPTAITKENVAALLKARFGHLSPEVEREAMRLLEEYLQAA
jgi:UDP-2,3-diacylglucosamine pyrophosphatase LpxH